MVSDSLHLQAGAERFRWVLKLIDAVHSADIPRLVQVEFTHDQRWGHGSYDGRSAAAFSRITVSRAGEHPELTLVHEVGHFLDDQALGHPGRFASLASPWMSNWAEAVRQSAAVERLQIGLAESRSNESVGGLGLTSYLINLLRPYELWARSYAQYIATRSGDSRLIAQVSNVRQHAEPLGAQQWSDHDFETVMYTIDDLFEVRGWR